jgi:alkanesulfonate monooxygenase SsuD/methylene tetrahydromethanopterin reductase-like flavin-dependent oxidoreductase (luciferase family)
MKLGMFMMPLHPVDRDMTRALREDLETVVHADKVGFDEMWVGEHATCLTEPIPNPMLFLASAIHLTSRIKLGTGVLNLPQHHPARAACEIAQFDHMSGGRMLLGVGPGGLRSDFELFKTEDHAARPAMVLESIDIMTRIWAQDPPYEFKGKFWDVTLKESVLPEFGIGWMPKPLQKPHPPIAVSAMSQASSSVRTAGARGWGVITAPFIHKNYVRTHWQALRDGAASAGRETDGSEWRVGRTVVVAPSDAEAEDAAFDPKGQYYFYYDYLIRQMKHFNFAVTMKPDPSVPDDALTAESAIADRVIHGSPKKVAEQILALREEVGPFGGLVSSQHDWDGKDFEKRSMRLLAEEVMPLVRRAA